MTEAETHPPRRQLWWGAGLLLFVGIGLILQDPAVRFFQFNRTVYLANLGQWDQAIKRLGEIEPVTFHRDDALLLKAEALIHQGEPAAATRLLESEPSSHAPRHKALLKVARLLSGESVDVVGRPDLGSLPERPLYQGTLRWIEARNQMEQGEPPDLERIQNLAERFSNIQQIQQTYGTALLRADQAGLGTAYLLAVQSHHDSSETSSAFDPEEDIRRYIDDGDLATALRLLHDLSPGAAGLREEILAQPDLSAATRLTARFTQKDGANSDTDHPTIQTTELINQKNPVALFALFSDASIWTADIPAAKPNTQRRVLVIDAHASLRGGVGAACSITIGYRKEQAYVGSQKTSLAFDIPMTNSRDLQVSVQLVNDTMKGIDPADGDRNLYLSRARVIDFGSVDPK